MFLRDRIIGWAKATLPQAARDWVVRKQRRYNLHAVRVGSIEWGRLRRLTPISPIFGIDRGFPIERYYIEKFLGENAQDIRGRTMELGDPFYIEKFGGDRVDYPEVLHYVEGNPRATIVADLTDAAHIESNSFDCIIFTQTLQMIYDLRAALDTLHRILKPGGTLLLTTHGISKIGRRRPRDDWGEYWHLTAQSCEFLFRDHFPDADVTIRSYGNVLAATAALHGIVSEELSEAELDHHDEDFEVVVCVRAQKR